jgi:hypothetical protein
LIDEAVKGLVKGTSHFGWAARARASSQDLRSLLGNTLPPCAEGRLGKVQGRGDGADVGASAAFPDGLRTAKDAGLLGLLEHGISGRQCSIAPMAFEGRIALLLRDGRGAFQM